MGHGHVIDMWGKERHDRGKMEEKREIGTERGMMENDGSVIEMYLNSSCVIQGKKKNIDDVGFQVCGESRI